MPTRAQPQPRAFPLAQRLIEERTRNLAQRRGRTPGLALPSGPTVLACAVGPEHVAFELQAIDGVIGAAPCTPLPTAPPAVLGLLGRGGHAWSVIDVGALLGIALPPPAPPTGHFLLLTHRPPLMALRVDRAIAVLPVLLMDAPPPGEGEARPRALAPAGALARSETVLALLDPERILRPLLHPAAAPGA